MRSIFMPICLAAALSNAANITIGQSSADPNAIHDHALQLMRQGYSLRAIAEFKRAIAEAERRYGPTHVSVYRFKINLANTYLADSQYDLAEPLLREAVLGDIAAFQRGQESALNVGTAANSMANYYHVTGQYAHAQEWLKFALYYYQSQGYNALASMAHANLGTNCRMMKDYDSALDWYEKSLRFRQKTFGTEDQRTGTVWANVACVYFDQGRFAEAEQLYRRSLEISRKISPPDGNRTLVVNLAFTLESLGEFDEAEQLFQRYLQLSEKEDESNHQSAAQAWAWIARSHAVHHRWGEAVEAMERNRRRLRPIVLRLAGGLSEIEQRTLVEIYTGGLDDAMSIAWARRSDAKTAELAAGWLMNAKGLLYRAMAERSLLVRDARLVGQSAAAEELQAVRARLSSLLSGGASGADDAQRRRRTHEAQQLAEREAQLSRQIGLAAGREHVDVGWVEPNAVRAALAGDAVLIDLTRSKIQDYDAPVGPAGRPLVEHYLAWVIPAAGKGEIAIVDLGDAKTIDKLVAELLANIEQTTQLAGNLREQLPAAEKDYRAIASRLAQKILYPLLPHAGSATHWILSPDADLWLVPYNALPLEDGSYFTEHYRLSHVVSARDVLAGASSPQPPAGPPLVVADPKYDLGVDKTQRRNSIEELPNAAKEVELAVPLLEKICGTRPVVRVREQALKREVLAAQSPRVLMLGTHGSFAPLPRGAGNTESPLFEPLLRCELLFAGCNAQPAPPWDNGVLLGKEVLDCDLRGTELVILSACQTGRGDVHRGQSAVGMRQAFQLAGARDVVATLWSVNDIAATRLTSGCLRQIAAGHAKAEALRLAQCELIRELDEQLGMAHPCYWAPYTLTGGEPCAAKKD